MSNARNPDRRRNSVRFDLREKSSVTLKRTFAETSFASERVYLCWQINDWRLCRKLLEHKRLMSPLFESPNCKWKLELIETTKNGNRGNSESVFTFQLYLEESTENSYTIDGSLEVAEFQPCIIEGVISLKRSEKPNNPHQSIYTLNSDDSQYATNSKSTIKITPDIPICNISEDNLVIIADFKYSSGNAVTKVSETDESESESWSRSLDDLKHQRDALCESLGALLSDNQESDMTIIVKETRFPAHKAILAARSQVFKAMIDEANSKGLSQEFEIECDNLMAWKEFQRFIYTGETLITPEELLSLGDALFRLQDKFDVVSLSDHLTVRLVSMLNCQTVLDVLELAFKHDVRRLSTAGLVVLTKHLNELKRDKGLQLVSFVQRHPEIAELVLTHSG